MAGTVPTEEYGSNTLFEEHEQHSPSNTNQAEQAHYPLIFIGDPPPDVPYWSISYLDPDNVLDVHTVTGPISTLRQSYATAGDAGNCYDIPMDPQLLTAFSTHQNVLVHATPEVVAQHQPQLMGVRLWNANCHTVLHHSGDAEIKKDLHIANGIFSFADMGLTWAPLTSPPEPAQPSEHSEHAQHSQIDLHIDPSIKSMTLVWVENHTLGQTLEALYPQYTGQSPGSAGTSTDASTIFSELQSHSNSGSPTLHQYDLAGSETNSQGGSQEGNSQEGDEEENGEEDDKESSSSSDDD